MKMRQTPSPFVKAHSVNCFPSIPQCSKGWPLSKYLKKQSIVLRHWKLLCPEKDICGLLSIIIHPILRHLRPSCQVFRQSKNPPCTDHPEPLARQKAVLVMWFLHLHVISHTMSHTKIFTTSTMIGIISRTSLRHLATCTQVHAARLMIVKIHISPTKMDVISRTSLRHLATCTQVHAARLMIVKIHISPTKMDVISRTSLRHLATCTQVHAKRLEVIRTTDLMMCETRVKMTT